MTTPGSTAARGYGATHVAERKRWAPKVAAGQCACTRCGQPIHPHQAWHLDHTTDRTAYLGVAHAQCNRRAGAKLGARRRWGRRRLTATTANRW